MIQPVFYINHRPVSLRTLLCICVVLLVCSSCSKEEDVSTDKLPLSFTFRAVEEARVSTGIYEAYSGQEFGVYASLYHPSFASADVVGAPFMENTKVVYDKGDCETDKNYYWQNGDTHFAAYSPYNISPETAELNLTMPATPYAGYRYSGVVDGHTDYMFSDEQLGGYEDFPSGSVPIIFHHALTKINFSVKLSKVQEGQINWSMDLVSLKVCNVRNRGNVSFTHGGKTNYDDIVSGGYVNRWYSNADEVWYTQPFPIGAAYDSNYLSDITVRNVSMRISDASEHDIDDTLYLMPQWLYTKSETDYVQSLVLDYKLHTTKNGLTKTMDCSVTVPLRTSNISKWDINRYINYKLVLEPGGTMELVAEVQPWDLVETTNEFSSVVTVLDADRIRWTKDSHNDSDSDPNNNAQIILWDDRSKPAEFTFKISRPLGSTWHAIFRTISGATDAFELRDLDGNLKMDGAVGEEVTLRVFAKRDNTTSVSNVAELMFVVRSNGHILPVDIITRLGEGKNYEIVQNINK